MATFDYDLGILGGGAAGLTAAAGGAQFGAKTILIEKYKELGGDCLHFGCVPSKTLIRTAGVWAHARRAADFGLPRLTLPPVDLGAVMDRVQSVPRYNLDIRDSLTTTWLSLTESAFRPRLG
jgi:pyruvate/2-oxoglutarate dehydrogenase complex dihydrolipoamide dehydrogenase (E3) component